MKSHSILLLLCLSKLRSLSSSGRPAGSPWGNLYLHHVRSSAAAPALLKCLTKLLEQELLTAGSRAVTWITICICTEHSSTLTYLLSRRRTWNAPLLRTFLFTWSELMLLWTTVASLLCYSLQCEWAVTCHVTGFYPNLYTSSQNRETFLIFLMSTLSSLEGRTWLFTQ